MYNTCNADTPESASTREASLRRQKEPEDKSHGNVVVLGESLGEPLNNKVAVSYGEKAHD